MEPKTISRRNYGIDLLRIVSMFMIVMLHSMGHGGLLKGTAPRSANYAVAWLLECGCYCAVNCFALVSGYVGLRSRFRLSGIAALWLQVVFYHAAFTVIWALAEHRAIDFALALQPVKNRAYWYYSAYFGISFFMPFLNGAVEHMDRRTAGIAAVGIVLLFSVYPTLSGTDMFKTDDGYHTIWLLVIYLLGACIRKHEPLKNCGKRVWALGYLAMVGLSCGALLLRSHIRAVPSLIQYTSPTILLAAVCLLMLFAKVTPGEKARKCIVLVSPLTFGVYLIHDSLFIRKTFISDSLTAAGSDPLPVMLAKLLGFAVLVFTVCLCIDYLRSRLFKALRIQKGLDALEKKILP